MDNRDFNKNIKKCITLLENNNFLFQAGCITSLEASDVFKKASRSSLSYRELYDIGASRQDFNIMLKDQSFFQFTKELNDNLRLVYYPNPYNFSEYQETLREYEDLLINGDLSNEEYEQFLSEEFFTSDIPLIRYDYAPNQYCENYHPAAHLHIGFEAENRWPVKRVLSPYAFLLKILMIYYSKLWKEWGNNGDAANSLDELYREELISCKHLDTELFSSIEEKRLYFH